jgi:hypothetical protein
MNSVWKYEIPIKEVFEIEMPAGAHILSVQVQLGKPCIWAMVNPEWSKEKRQFRLASTGEPIRETFIYDPKGGPVLAFVGTFQIHVDEVYHLFELRGKETK